MTSIRAALASILAFVLSAPAAAAPLEAYGRLPVVEAVALSPDGTALATINTDGDQRLVAVRNLADGKLISGVVAGDVKVRDIRWAGPDHVLIMASQTANIMETTAKRSEWSMLLVHNIRDRSLKRLMEDVAPDETRLNVAGATTVRVIDGKPYAFVTGVHFINGRGRSGLYRVDLTTAKSQLLEPGLEYTYEWLVDAQGQPLAQSQYDLKNRQWRLRIRQGKGWPVMKTLDAVTERPDLVGLGRDGRSILVKLTENGRQVFREVSPADGSWGPPFEAGERSYPIFGATNRMIGASRIEGDEKISEFYDPKDQKLWSAVKKAFPGEHLEFCSGSIDNMKIVILVDSPTLGPAFALVDLKTGKSDFIGDLYRGLKAADISPVRPIRFKAADGLDLSGYLTVPRGRDPKSLPLVVLPQDGPIERDLPEFNWWSQALASRGYAVLQVNFRGSDGFGPAFTAAGFGQWGRKMQTDLSDGVRHLVREGVVDPKRVCIVGSDYGGYAALAGVTLQQGVYRCAASVGGPADLKKLDVFNSGPVGRGSHAFWNAFMGGAGMNDPRLNEISPVAHAAKADAPILLVHGRDDTIVPSTHSQAMADALKKAGKPVKLILLDEQDHWMSRGKARLQMLEAVVAFLEKNNPPT